jgi:ribosomal protein S12 methylthiotransferase
VAGKSKIHIVTLGCPKNQVDSEVLQAQLQSGNVEMVSDADNADTIVINTCGFIQDAKQESIDAIVEAIEKKKHGEVKNIIVMGCLAERFKKDLAKELPEVDSFFGTRQMPEILSALGINYKHELLGERILSTPSHTAYLKISEGCDNPCSFCAIPQMRGEHHSTPVEELVHESLLLAAKGVKELVVIAQDSTYYGLDLYGERRLASLLGELQAVDGIDWIRLMYAYPAKFPSDVLQAFQQYSKLCRYIDMPVQHIADNVLKSMRRGISQRATKELLWTIKKEIPAMALRTTLIVGYPTETEDDFKQLCDFVQEMKFHRLGVFTYSQEEGTGAYELGDPIPNEVKQERQAMLMEIQKNISEERNESLVGQKLKVLIDSCDGEQYVGRTEWDAPEVDQEVLVHSARALVPGQFISAVVTGAAEYDLFADAQTEAR